MRATALRLIYPMGNRCKPCLDWATGLPSCEGVHFFWRRASEDVVTRQFAQALGVFFLLVLSQGAEAQRASASNPAPDPVKDKALLSDSGVLFDAAAPSL